MEDSVSNLQTKEKLEKTDILKLFTSGFKTEKDLNVGIEYERLPIYSETAKAVPYEGD